MGLPGLGIVFIWTSYAENEPPTQVGTSKEKSPVSSYICFVFGEREIKISIYKNRLVGGKNAYWNKSKDIITNLENLRVNSLHFQVLMIKIGPTQ